MMSNWRARAGAWLCAVIAAISLSACSRTIEWQEEVPLNTGETVWVKRSVEYTVQGEAGNPFDLGWRTRRGTARLSFEWAGKSWQFDSHGGPLLLAIGPDRRPAILALAEAGAWNATHHYACTLPYYVQFVPDGSGRHWTWPAAIDPFFFGQRTNLLQDIPRPDTQRRSYPAALIRATNERVLVQSSYRQGIDPMYTGDSCRRLLKQGRGPRR